MTARSNRPEHAAGSAALPSPQAASPSLAARRRPSWIHLLIGALLGASWFGIVFAARPLEALHGFGGADPWITTSVWRLIVGGALVFIIVPLAWKAWRREDRYLDIVGLRAPRGRQWLWTGLILAACVTPTLLVPDALGVVLGSLGTGAALAAALQPPIVEETLMRGTFVHVMAKGGWNPVLTSLIGAVLFATWHVASFGPDGWWTGLAAIPLMYVVRYLTGGTIAPMAVHLALNAQAPYLPVVGGVLLIELAALIVWLATRRSKRLDAAG